MVNNSKFVKGSMYSMTIIINKTKVNVMLQAYVFDVWNKVGTLQ
jgi:hypothetical protein